MKLAAPLTAASGAPLAGVVAAVNEPDPQAGVRGRARSFAEPLLAGETTPSGENLLAHADAGADILAGIGGAGAI